MVMGYQFCLAINFLILIKYNIFYETIFLHMIIIHRFWIKRKKKIPRFGVMDIQSCLLIKFFILIFIFLDKSIFNIYQIFFCETVYLYMIIGFLLPKILPPLFLLIFKFKLNYKFIQSTIFIFIFYKI